MRSLLSERRRDVSQPDSLSRQLVPALEFAQQPQRQDSLWAQLHDVIALANRAGCYDAADMISRQFFPENHIGLASDAF